MKKSSLAQGHTGRKEERVELNSTSNSGVGVFSHYLSHSLEASNNMAEDKSWFCNLSTPLCEFLWIRGRRWKAEAQMVLTPFSLQHPQTLDEP